MSAFSLLSPGIPFSTPERTNPTPVNGEPSSPGGGISPAGQAALALAWAELDGEPLEIGEVEGDDDPDPDPPAALAAPYYRIDEWGQMVPVSGNWSQDEEEPQDEPTEDTLPEDLPLPTPLPTEPTPALLSEVRRLCSLLRWALAPQLCADPEQLSPVIAVLTVLESGRCAALEIGRLSVVWRGRDPELLDALVSLDRALDHDLVAQISTLPPTGWGAREWLRAAQQRVCEYGASAPRAVSLAPEVEGPELPPELAGAECVRLYRAADGAGRILEAEAAARAGDALALHQLYRVLVGPRVYRYAINPRSQDRGGSAAAEIVGVLALGALLALSLGYLLGLVG